MSIDRHFDSFTEARTRLRAVLDAAQLGVVTTVQRDRRRFVVISADDLREDLAALRPSDAVALAEGGGWSVVLPGLPVHGDGETFDDALEDVVTALRDYAADWNDRLHDAPNHRVHRTVVELVELSDDAQLRSWVVGGSGTEPGPVAQTQPGDGSAQHSNESAQRRSAPR